MDKYEYMLKNDGRLKTSPIKGQYSDTTSNQLAESANRRRKEEEERKKREEEERKRRLKLDAETQAIKTLANDNRDRRLANQEEQAHPIKTTTKSGSGRGFDEVSSPTKRAMDNLPQSNSRQSYQRWSEGENVKKYKDYSNGLGEDVRNTIEYSKVAGLKDDEIKNSLIPPEDNTIEERLQEIGSKLRPGRESWGQNMQEGWYEKELQDMLSKETLRQMNGLPNKADVIQKFMAENPELGISEDANILDKGIRFLAEGTRQQLDSYSAASKNWESWAIAGAIVAGASLLAPVTGGSSLLVGGTLLGNSTLALGSLGALKLGMSYGSMKHMKDLETADKYNQYIQEGVHPEIAKKQAATVGAINGMIEFMQIDSAFSTIPGVANLLDNGKKLAGKEFTKELTKIAANYGVDLLGNALEESAQEATGLMGLELSKYLENAPNPNTLEGLKVLAKTFDKEDYRERILQSGMDALQSMWLSPIVSSGVRQGASMGVNSAITKSQSKKVNGYYTAEERQSQEFNDAQKKMLLTDTEENQIDMMIKDYNESRDERTLAAMVTTEQVLDAIAQREDTTNQERELIQKSRDKINNIVSQAMYDAKDENSDIEYKATNNQDIESEITSTDFEGEIYTPTFNEYAIERFNDAKDAGVLETIKEELIKGTSKSEISNKITKALPRKMRNPLDVATMINAVESVQKEVNAQKVMNNLHNYDLIKDYKPTEVDVEGEINVNEDAENIEATEEPQAEVKGVSDTVVQTDVESPTESLVEPVGDIETELETTEVESATEEYKKADVVKVPVRKVFKDEKRFQFRYYGTTNKLDGATFDQDLSGPLMLFRDKFRDLYVFNGHHRLRLAEQSGVEYIDARIYDSKDYTAEEVRALGAIVNIAENHAEAVDVAKVLRDSTITTDELKKYLSPRSKVMRDGIALSNLNDWIFTQVATSKIPTDIGVVIGNALPGNKAGQNQIVKAIDKLQLQGKDITPSILTEMVAEVKGTAQETFTEQTLFGEETFTKSVEYERATLVGYVKDQLRSKKSLLKSVTKNKNASMLESLGNKIAADENTEQLEQSELALLLLDKTLNYQGTKVNKLFNDLALEYSKAEPKDRAAIKRKALDELISLMEGGNLLGENATTKQRKQRQNIERSSKNSSDNGTRGQESINDSEQIITEEQEEIAGQEALFALREQPQVEIVADDDVKNTRVYKSTIKIVEALQKNVFFNGLKVNYSNKSGKIVFDSKKELKERGYEHYEVGKTYYIYGAYDNRTREITLNSEAARDTILEEAIHDIQSRIQEINPELGVTIQAWENEVREQAAALGYEIPGGYELLAQALVFSELGYASSNKDIANLIAVDDEIVVGMKAILGRDVLKEGQGLVESETAKKDRELKGMYENYAKRIFTQDGFLDNLLEAEENRKTEIRAELANARAATYYHPSNGQYVIVSPSTKGAKYQVTTFSPKFDPISDGQFDTIDEVADRLIDNKFYYKANEIHYQLKQFTRGVVDELYGIAISRGYRTDNSTRTNGESISFSITDNQIIDAYHDARVGNFSAHDFDELIKDNKDISVRVKNNIIRGIFEAAKKGLDVDNSEVTFLQYLHRFHGMPTRFSTYLWDTPLKEELTSTDRIYYEDGEIVTSTISYTTSTKKEILEGDTGVKETKWIEYDNLSEAISQYKMAMDRDVSKSLYKDFPYLNYKEIENIEKDYIDFRDNVETYRHKGIKTDFDRQSHHAISYETKAILENEIYYVDGIKVIKNPTMDQIQEIYYDVEYMRPGVLNKRTAHESTFDNKGNNYVWNTTLATREAVETAIKNELGIDVSLENVSKGVWSEGDILYQLKAATDTTEFKNWFKDSKVVDEEGNPLVVYHGTNYTFDTFDISKLGNSTGNKGFFGKGFYFTTDEYLAREYYAKLGDGNNERVIEAYLSMNNPYEIPYGYLGSQDGNFTENIISQGYDGVIVRYENGDIHELVVFNPTQIKSIFNHGMFNEYDPNISYQLKEVTHNINQYTLEAPETSYNAFVKGNLTTTLQYKDNAVYEGLKVLEVDKEVDGDIYNLVLRGAVLDGYDYIKMADKEPIAITKKDIGKALSEKPIFQLKEVEGNGNLLAIHNIFKGNLKSVLKLGGFPMPSIAITKKDFKYTEFGDVSLLFNKQTIDPSNELNKVFAGDAWTPTFPSVQKTFLGINGEFIQDKQGNEYPVTLDNVLKVMKGQETIRAAQDPKGLTKLYVTLTKEFNSIEEIKAESTRLTDNAATLEEKQEENYYLYHEVIKDIIEDSTDDEGFSYVREDVVDAITSATINTNDDYSVDSVTKLMDDRGIEITEMTATKLANFMQQARTIAVEYFEAKPQRIVGIDEIQAAMINTTNLNQKEIDDIRELLKGAGVNLIEEFNDYATIGWRKFSDTNYNLNIQNSEKYLIFNESGLTLQDIENKIGNEWANQIKNSTENWGVIKPDSRNKAVDGILRQNDVSFQLKETKTNTTTKEFKNWFKDSKVVDEEGRPLVVYHGTDAKFDKFNNQNQFFSTSEEFAGRYASGIGSVGGYYLSIESLFDPFNREHFNTFINEIKEMDPDLDLIYENANYDLEIEYDEMDKVDFKREYADSFKYINYDSFANDNRLHEQTWLLFEQYSDIIKSLGYGGMKITEEDTQNYVAFYPNQIKSVNNQGTYDVNDTNIYYQLKEEPDLKERSWGQTIRDAELTTPWLTELLTSNKFMYEVKHNEDTMIAAAQLIDTKGEEYVEARLLSDLDNDAVLMAASQILTYKYMESGEQDRAMAMIDKTAEKATSLGQAIQILSVWGRQTPEGMLRYTSQAFRKSMTDKDRQMVGDKTKTLTEAFNDLNKQAIEDIDLVGTVKQVQDMPIEERATRDTAAKGGALPDGGFTSEMLQPFENTIDDNMADRIISVVNQHYQEGTGNLKDKLRDLGLNDFEVEILDKYVKQKVKEATRDSKQMIIDKELSKQKHERKGIDEQILDLASEGKVDENLLKNLVGEKEGMPVLNKDLVDYIYTQGQYINSLPQGRQRDVETGKMIQTIMDQVPVSIWQKINTFRIMSMLLNAKTTIRNLVGNDMFRRLDTFTLNFFGTPIDKALSSASGQRTMLFRPIDAGKKQNLGYKEGWRLGLEDALLGINTSDASTQFELRNNRTFKSGVLGKAEMVMDIALRATDRAAMMATFMDSLEEQMQLAGVDVATEEMTANAMELALYRTFQDETALSNMFTSIKKGANNLGFGGEKIEGSKKRTPNEFGLGDLIMPFPKTPANILGRAIDYSPIGLVVTALKLARDTSGDQYLKQRTTAEGVSRALMGTGLIAIGAMLAKMGILTGSNPDDDEDIYKLQKAHGLRDFSVNISAIGRHILSGFTDSRAGELRKGDQIASYDWAEPIAMPLAIGADTELGGTDAKDLLSVVIRAWETGVTALTSQPLLTGLSNLFRYGDLGEGISQLFLDMPASFTPTLFSHVAQFIDGRDTDPYTFYEGGRAVASKVMNKVPGARGMIPSRYTVLGGEKRYYPENQNLATRAANIFLNPSITAKYMPTDEAEFLFDLYNATGDSDIVPRPPQKDGYQFDGVKYTFTPESWEEMSKWLGNEYKSRIGYAMDTYMKGWSAEEQADEIKFLTTEIKKEAREKIFNATKEGTIIKKIK